MGRPIHPLTFRAPLTKYAFQADDLLAGWRAGEEDSVKVMRHHHPRFLDEKVKWLPRGSFGVRATNNLTGSFCRATCTGALVLVP
jgi:hypothetical protein